MRNARPSHESDLVAAALAPVLAKLRGSDDIQEEFLDFARKYGGANPMRLPARLYHILREDKPRLPDPYVTTLLLLFAKEKALLPRIESLRVKSH